MPFPPRILVALGAMVLVAFAVEAAVGFGATVVAVTLGAFLVPIEDLLPAFVLLNLGLSAYLAARYRRDVDARLLLRRILPLMALGLPFGVVAARHLGTDALRGAFGVFVALLSGFELRKARDEDRGALRGSTGSALLVLGGVIHGVFATGGPLAVYVAGREIADKARFRASLAVLWLLLNAALVASYAAEGRVGASTTRVAAALAPGLLLGILAGESAHRRVPAALFHRIVFTLLLIAGCVLAIRALL